MRGSWLRIVLAACVILALAGLMPVRAAEGEAAPTKIVTVKMRDGTSIAVALYMPAKPGKYPALFAASPIVEGRPSAFQSYRAAVWLEKPKNCWISRVVGITPVWV